MAPPAWTPSRGRSRWGTASRSGARPRCSGRLGTRGHRAGGHLVLPAVGSSLQLHVLRNLVEPPWCLLGPDLGVAPASRLTKPCCKFKTVVPYPPPPCPPPHVLGLRVQAPPRVWEVLLSRARLGDPGSRRPAPMNTQHDPGLRLGETGGGAGLLGAASRSGGGKSGPSCSSHGGSGKKAEEQSRQGALPPGRARVPGKAPRKQSQAGQEPTATLGAFPRPRQGHGHVGCWEMKAQPSCGLRGLLGDGQSTGFCPVLGPSWSPRPPAENSRRGTTHAGSRPGRNAG